MEDSQKHKYKRPISHSQLLIFPNNSEYIMDDPKEYLKEPQRNKKFSIKELHQKWKRKGNVNFKKIDKKFDTKKIPQMKRIKTEEEEKQNKQFFDLTHGIYYEKKANKENTNNILLQNFKNKAIKYDKYNDKYSYYLNTDHPWNSESVFNLKDRKNNDKKILGNIKIAKQTNELINNHNKSYKSLNERYMKNKFLITEVKNQFIKDKKEEISKKLLYENPDLKKCPEKINALIFKEMIKSFKEYAEYIENKKNNLNLSSSHNFTDEEIFDRLHVLLIYLKEHKQDIDQKQFLEPLISNYNKILEKEEYLKKIDSQYIEDNKMKEYRNIDKKSNIVNLFKYPIKEKINQYKFNSFRISNNDEPKDIINKNKEINYFLTAYKSVIEENKEKEEKIKKEKKQKRIFNIISEKSTNPYILNDYQKNKNKDNLKNDKDDKSLKRPNSCVGRRQINITYYHPGNYFLFKEGESEYYAWSCCLNEDKYSKGCSKKNEKVLNFLYKY